MSKYRYMSSDFWSDIWVVDYLNPLDRYLYMYLFTNPYINLVGVYELSLRIMSFETGIERDQLINMLKRLEPRVKYINGWVVLRNGVKHQNYRNQNINAGIKRECEGVPSELLQHINWPSDFGEKPKTGSKQVPLFDRPYQVPLHPTVTNTELNTTVGTSKSVEKSDSRTIGLKKSVGKQYLEIDLLYEDLHDLVNDKFKAWYCKVFYKLGRERVLRLASEAKADGKEPVKLFSHLLTEASGVKKGVSK